MSRFSLDPPDDDRYSDREPDVQDTPQDGESWTDTNTGITYRRNPLVGDVVVDWGKVSAFSADPIDPAEHAMHTLIDALTDLEKAIVSATTLERVQQLKQLTKRAFAQANAVDLKASATMDVLVERRR